jgi:hypothetical protein
MFFMNALRICYLYRDASNYKFRGEFVLSGFVSEHDIRKYLIDGEYFIPRAVGLPSLVPENENCDDHQLHEIEHLIQEQVEVPVNRLSADFLLALRSASIRGWFNG